MNASDYIAGIAVLIAAAQGIWGYYYQRSARERAAEEGARKAEATTQRLRASGVIELQGAFDHMHKDFMTLLHRMHDITRIIAYHDSSDARHLGEQIAQQIEQDMDRIKAPRLIDPIYRQGNGKS